MRRTISEHIHPPLMSVHSEHVQTFLKDYEHGTMLWVDLLAFLRRRSKGAGLSVLCLGWSPNQFVHSTHAEFSPNDFIWSHGNTDEPPMCNAPPSNQLNPDQDLAHRVILERARFSVVVASPNSDNRYGDNPRSVSDLLVDRSDVVVFDGASEGSHRLIDLYWDTSQTRRGRSTRATETPCFLTHRDASILLPIFGAPSSLGQLKTCLMHVANERAGFDSFARAVLASRITDIDEMIHSLSGLQYEDARARLEAVAASRD